MQVLIVEDDPHLQSLVKEVVDHLGHSTVCAADGAEALALHHTQPADVVVSDWMMPGLDGLQLCRRLRTRPGEPYTYFILLSALSDTQHRLAAVQAGADDSLAKPFSIDDIEARLIVAQRVIRVHRRNESLLRMTRRLAAEADPNRLVHELLRQAIELVGGSSGVVTRWDEDRQGLEPVAATAPMRDAKDAILTEAELSSAVTVPLIHERRLIGSLTVGVGPSSAGRSAFTQEDAELLETLASTAAAALVALEDARLDGALLAARTAQHELNNQLAVARGYAKLLVGSPDLPSNLEVLARHVMRAADAAAATLRQLRNISRIHERRWDGPHDTTINLARSQHRRGAA